MPAHLAPTAQHDLGELPVQRQLVEQQGRGGQRHDLVDPLVADLVEMSGYVHLASALIGLGEPAGGRALSLVTVVIANKPFRRPTG